MAKLSSEESAGVDEIARTLVSAFDRVDVVALGEVHPRKADPDPRIAVVRQPDFATKVRFVVVECDSTTEQSTLDRYIRGEDVSTAELAQVWRTTTQGNNGFMDDPVYADFLKAVRDVNSNLPVEWRIRVLGGDPGRGDNRSRETAAIAVLKQHVLQKHGKTLMIYGAGHFYPTLPTALAPDHGRRHRIGEEAGNRLSRSDSGVDTNRSARSPTRRTADIEPDHGQFDCALKTPVRPVLLSLQRSPFRDFSAEEFLGRTITHCDRVSGCASGFKGSTLTLGQMADACVYFGGGH